MHACRSTLEDPTFGATANLGTTPDGVPLFLGICGKDGYCYSLDPETGQLRWATNVVFGGFSGGFIATTAFDGTRVYGATAIGDFGRFEMGTQVVCQPGNPADLPLQEPSMHSFDATTGAVSWQAVASTAFGPTSVAGGMVFVPLGITPQIHIHDAASGSLISTIPVPANSDSGVVTVGNALFFGIGTSQQPAPAGVMAYTPLGAPPEMPRSDNYRCYSAMRATPTFSPRNVTLADDFESVAAVVSRPDTTCNPADVHGEGMGDATAHLACYRIREPRGFTSRSVLVRDRFGDVTLTLSRPQGLCVPSEQNHVASALNIDHYKCYKALRATPRFTRQLVNVADEFVSTTTLVKRPVAFCNAVDKNGEGIQDASAHLTCYAVKDPPPRLAARNVDIHNQFGNETRSVTATRTLCVPSTVP